MLEIRNTFYECDNESFNERSDFEKSDGECFSDPTIDDYSELQSEDGEDNSIIYILVCFLLYLVFILFLVLQF